MTFSTKKNFLFLLRKSTHITYSDCVIDVYKLLILYIYLFISSKHNCCSLFIDSILNITIHFIDNLFLFFFFFFCSIQFNDNVFFGLFNIEYINSITTITFLYFSKREHIVFEMDFFFTDSLSHCIK